MNQHELILGYIRDHGSISQKECTEELACTKLATRVSEMIRAGVPILKWWEKGKNKFGDDTRYKRYGLGRQE